MSREATQILDELCEAARDRLTQILAASLTPATHAAIIADLTANDQVAAADQQIADRFEAAIRKQLDCMVGRAEARRMIEVEQTPGREHPFIKADDDGAVCPHCEAVNHFASEVTGDDRLIEPGADHVCGSCGQAYVATTFLTQGIRVVAEGELLFRDGIGELAGGQ